MLEETLSAAHIIGQNERKSEKFKSPKTPHISKFPSNNELLGSRTQEDFENQDSDWFYLNVMLAVVLSVTA